MKWEHIISAAADRIVDAIERRGLPTAPQTPAHERVDMREQLLAQAPEQAAGYRLVLPPKGAGDPPKLSPARSRAREVSWYSLGPFEYPDDIRLCDDTWYRIIWVDAQGQRIRLQAGEPVPGLYYFVGPAQLQGSASDAKRELGDAHATPHAEPIDTRPEPVIEGQPEPAPRPSPAHMQSAINRAVARLSFEDFQALDAANFEQGSSKRPSLLAALPPQLVAEIPDSMKSVLGTMAALTVETSLQLIRFVQNPEWMLQLLYEERLAEAQATGGALPQQPPTGLSHDERKTIRDILTGMVPEHFMTLCKLIHAFARKYGLEVLDCLPTPPPPLPEAERQRLQSAISNSQKLAYLHYVYAWQQCLMRSLPLPREPSVTLSSKEKNQLRRLMRDLRTVMLFEKQARPPLSFLQR